MGGGQKRIKPGEVIEAAAKLTAGLGKGVLTRPEAVSGRTDSCVIGWLTDEAKGWDAIFLIWKDRLGKIQAKRVILLEGPILSGIPQAKQEENAICIKFQPSIDSLFYPILEMDIEELMS